MNKCDACSVLVIMIIGSALIYGFWALMDKIFELGKMAGCGS